VLPANLMTLGNTAQSDILLDLADLTVGGWQHQNQDNDIVFSEYDPDTDDHAIQPICRLSHGSAPCTAPMPDLDASKYYCEV